MLLSLSDLPYLFASLSYTYTEAESGEGERSTAVIGQILFNAQRGKRLVSAGVSFILR